MDSDRTFTLQALRREFGVTSRTLRYYEEQDLLDPARRGDERVYTSEDRSRLRLVLICRRAGMSLSEVREALSAARSPDGDPVGGMGDLGALRALTAALAQRRTELDSLILELKRMRARVSEVSSRRSASGRCEAPRSVLEFRPKANGRRER